MIYIASDFHRDFYIVADFCKNHNTTKDDILIVTGDSGINYYRDKHDKKLKLTLSKLPITIFCLTGNHDYRPENILSYKLIEFCEGKVYQQEDYPNLLFAKDGEIYNFNGLKTITINGAYSVDKFYRIERGWNWFEDEQPSDKTKKYIEKQLSNLDWKIDCVLSHTCPYKYIPHEAFLPMVDQSTVDNSTELWLNEIEAKLEYNVWYCGHFHLEKSINKMKFLYTSIIEFK